MEKITQTAGRDILGDFAPLFAHLNDDVLFGEVWNENAIDVKTKCIVTVVALIASGDYRHITFISFAERKYSPCGIRRRIAADLRRRARLVPRSRKASGADDAGYGYYDSCERQALARRCIRQLVFSFGNLNPR